MADYYAHESSYVDAGAQVGQGTKIWHFSHVMPGAVIGSGCTLGQNVVVMPGTKIGDNVKIQNNVSIYEGVILEDDTFCGPSCVFTNVINPRSEISRKHEFQRTWVKRGSTIGANATIVCGITLGEYSFIGAGAVVTSDVPAFGLMLGGTLMAAFAMLDGSASVLYTFYPPLRANPVFYIGAALLVVGSWIPFFQWIAAYLAWRGEEPGRKTPLAVVGMMATFTIWLIATLPLAWEVIVMLIP